jgi:hypothetical protein
LTGNPAVVKVGLGAGGAAPVRVGAAPLDPATEGGIGSAVIDSAHGYAYFGTYSPSVVPAKVVKVALGAGSSAPARVTALTLDAGDRELCTGVIDPLGGYAFFGTDHTHPAKVFKIALGAGASPPVKVGELQLAAGSLGTGAYPPDGGNISAADADLYGELYLQSSVIDVSSGTAWFGTDTVPGQIVKVSLGDAFPPTSFYALPPCRILDTRDPNGPLAGPALAAGARRNFVATGTCGVPPTARSLSVNVTVTQPAAAGDIRLFPGDTFPKTTTTINFAAGQTRANNAILLLASDGSGTFGVQNDAAGLVHFIVDVNGWFE